MFPITVLRRRRFASRSNRRASGERQIFRSRRLGMESLESRELLSAAPMTFQVVDDAAANISYRYSDTGTPQGSLSLAAANSAPRGVASTVAVAKTWVIDANRNVYVYDTGGGLLGSWAAGSMASNAAPEGIATDGNDVWIIDAKSDKVFRYAGAASRLSGIQSAASSFNLNSSNANPKDMVTDGASLWVVDDTAKTDRVFKYSIDGSYIGSWTIDSANKTPTGIALNPAKIDDMWIADSGTDRVYKYTAAASRNSGSQAAASNFALTTGNGNAQGLVVPGRAWSKTPYDVSWVRQFGGPADDIGWGVAADGGGNAYLSGGSDLVSYDSAGNFNWVQQQQVTPGTGKLRVEADSLGNVFQVEGAGDATLHNYTTGGSLQWTTSLPPDQLTNGVAADDLGYAYTVSYNWGNDIYIRKFDAQTGAILWVQTLTVGSGTASFDVSADHLGNIFVAGYTSGSLLGPNAGGADGWVAKYSDAGVFLWARQFGSAGTDYVWDVAADTLGNVYTVGQTTGALSGPNAGENDIFVTKHDSAGNLQWIRQTGTSGDETFNGVWADQAGNVYASGWTRAALGGPSLGGLADALMVKYSTAGDLLWSKQLGTIDRDATNDVFGDDIGNIYLAGNTRGSWAAPNAGGADFVLIKLSPPAAAASSATVDFVVASAPRTGSSDDFHTTAAVGTASKLTTSTRSRVVPSTTTSVAGDNQNSSDLLLAATPVRRLPGSAVDSALADTSDDNSTGWDDSLDEELLLLLTM